MIAIQPIYWLVGQIYRKHSSFIVACWTVFTELLPGNEFIKFVAMSRIEEVFAHAALFYKTQH
jgi:hypothetical protein